jgi:hypothetical protein
MPITLTTLFTTPADVWDVLSVEGVDLREDDHNLATGQSVLAVADALVNATAISVQALVQPLLRGAQLTFDGAGMPSPATATLTTVGNIGDIALTVNPLTTQINAGATARDSGVNVATGARLNVGCRKGTSKVKLYCNAAYDDSQLKLSGTVLDWATICAARFLAKRRAQPCPKGIEDDYQEAIDEMRQVQSGQLRIEDIGTRGVDWPAMSNVIVNPGYDVVRARVIQQISEQTPTAYNQWPDWASYSVLEW